MKTLLLSRIITLAVTSLFSAFRPVSLPGPTAKPRTIIYIVADDDHRSDFRGFTGQVAGLKTPGPDRLARTMARNVRHAFVSTALCSSSRAGILTG